MRIFKALTGGLAVGVVLLEALRASLQAFSPEVDFNESISNASTIPVHIMIGLPVAWLVAGLVAGAMAAAMAGNFLVGWIAGMLLCIPAGLILVLSGLGGSVVATALLPLAGAIFGSAIARRIYMADAA